MDFPFRGSRDTDSTNAFHTPQRGDKFVVQDLVKPHKTLVRLGRKDHHRHVIHTELEEHRNRCPVRQGRVHQVKLVPDVVAGLVNVGTVLKLQDNDRGVFLGPGSDVLEVFHTVQSVLKHLCQVVLDVGSARSRI